MTHVTARATVSGASVELDPDRDARAEYTAEAQAYAALWAGAIKLYYADCRSALKGLRYTNFEALDDFTGSRRLLANLCRPIGLDPEVVACEMERALQ